MAGELDEMETHFHLIHFTSCKHSLVFLRMGEIIARNMLS